MRKTIGALVVLFMALGLGVLSASSASAHTPRISASCDGVHLAATAYDPGIANRWSVTIDGVTEVGTFGAAFDQTFPVPQDGATTSWSALIEAADGSFRGSGSGEVGPCGTPPDEGSPPDACPDLPGQQPAGTSCIAPPDVEREDVGARDGCDVRFEGTRYGAGEVTYEMQYADTYVFNSDTSTFDLVTDTTPTITNVVFTPWTAAQQVEHGCVDESAQPPAEHTGSTSTRLDCDDDVQVTTTVTTTTPYVFESATNTWVPGQPINDTSTTEQAVQSRVCDAAGTRQVGYAPTVPTSVAAGVGGDAVAAGSDFVSAPVSHVSASTPNHDRSSALLLLMAGLALIAGAFRFRRS
jgi:hypothetical protein